MVIEDDEDLRSLVAEILESAGYTVCGARNGRHALELLDGVNPSLILMDWCMPEMNGGQFLDVLRVHPTRASVPVVVVSAWGTSELAARGLQVLRKPVSIEELLSVVGSYCLPPRR